MHQPVNTDIGRIDRKVRAALHRIEKIVHGFQKRINQDWPPKLLRVAPEWDKLREGGYIYSVLYYLLLVLQLQLQVTWLWLDYGEATDYMPYELLRQDISPCNAIG